METRLSTKIFLLILGIVIALFSAEAVLRMRGALSMTGNFRFDPDTGLLTLKPNVEFYTTYQSLDAKPTPEFVKANSHGFWGRDFSYDKPDDVYRIVLLGDSMIEAYYIPSQQTIFHILETKLNQEAGEKKFEVYAIAKGGAMPPLTITFTTMPTPRNTIQIW